MAGSVYVLRAKVYRDFGSRGVEVELSCQVDKELLLPEFDQMVDRLHEAMNHYAAEKMGKPLAAPRKLEYPDYPGHDVKSVSCTRVTVEIKEGKRLYKCHCGDWGKHGVRIWPEVLQSVNIKPNMIDGLDGHGLIGYHAHVIMSSDGKNNPIKVVRLVKDDADL